MYYISAVLSLAVLAGLVFWVWKRTAAGTCWNPVFWPGLIFKLVCGILLGLYYSGGDFDTTRYQEAADILTGFGFQDTGAYLRLLFLNDYTALPEQIHSIGFRTYSNSFYFSKLLSVLNFLTGSNYYLNSLFLSFFSFAGCWYLVKNLAHYFPGTANAAIFSFLLFPSVVFWNAGVMKESLLAGLLGFFWAAILNLSDPAKKHKPGYFFLLAISAFGLWKIKFFVAAFVYGLAGLWLVLHWLRRRFRVFRQPVALVGSLTGLSALLALAISRLHENFNLQFFLDRLVWNYQ
ncbi:MAG TPA: hypothetical protein VK927_03535, partial [Adhaeribacter sp.]|nr:hypothetical protein [Adhaeribacter sp.]